LLAIGRHLSENGIALLLGFGSQRTKAYLTTSAVMSNRVLTELLLSIRVVAVYICVNLQYARNNGNIKISWVFIPNFQEIHMLTTKISCSIFCDIRTGKASCGQ